MCKSMPQLLRLATYLTIKRISSNHDQLKCDVSTFCHEGKSSEIR
jgi:hypothetical protein